MVIVVVPVAGAVDNAAVVTAPVVCDTGVVRAKVVAAMLLVAAAVVVAEAYFVVEIFVVAGAPAGVTKAKVVVVSGAVVT